MKSVFKKTDGKIVAIDGKCLRRSFDKSKGFLVIHMLSAWATENGVVMGQQKVDSKSNAITAIPKLLFLLECKGCIFTMDTMGCQKGIAEDIMSKEADYVLGLKANQRQTLGEVEMSFDTSFARSIKVHEFESIDSGHGRIETRRYTSMSAAGIKNLSSWVGCKSAVMVESVREKKSTGQSSRETRYYISSLAPEKIEQI